MPKLKADCSHPDVVECTDNEGKIIENPKACEAKCKIQKDLCPELPECQVNLDYCRRASCKPIRVKTCPGKVIDFFKSLLLSYRGPEIFE